MYCSPVTRTLSEPEEREVNRLIALSIKESGFEPCGHESGHYTLGEDQALHLARDNDGAILAAATTQVSYEPLNSLGCIWWTVNVTSMASAQDAPVGIGYKLLESIEDTFRHLQRGQLIHWSKRPGMKRWAAKAGYVSSPGPESLGGITYRKPIG